MATYRITLEIEHLPEGPFLGTSPDLPGLIMQAASPEDVIRLAPEIAHDLIEVMRETGQLMPAGLQPLPTPRTLPLLIAA